VQVIETVDRPFVGSERSWTVSEAINRRRFVRGLAAKGLVIGGGLARMGVAAAQSGGERIVSNQSEAGGDAAKAEYRGPNVIIVRFGGGVRRRETINAEQTYSPFFLHELTKRGTFFPNMEIASLNGVETSHGQGTLYLLTGKYDHYEDVEGRFLGGRFEAKVPTLFEYLRKTHDIPEHQTLIVNGEDRIDEEFYTFSNHHLFGVHYRSEVLSLYRFKTYLLRRQIEAGKWTGAELEKKRQQLDKMITVDVRVSERRPQPTQIETFWERWRQHYGESGFVNPRGDRLLTELTIRALAQLRPRLLMVNYNDPDYVHWGNMSHYTRSIAIIDEGLQRLVAAVEADAEYRDNTVFVIVPDCGRDTNPFIPVPCQHHFGSKSSHEIFALLFGPGIPRGVVVNRLVQQIDLAPTLGQMMGVKTALSEGAAMPEAFA
jgi:Sulfatase